MKCKACGAEITDNAKYCNSCGEKVEQLQNASNENVVETTSPKSNEEKYSGKEMVDKIAKLITGGLSVISVIMVIGAFLGFFDNDPIPLIILVGVVMFANWLEEKMPRVPTVFFAVFEIIALIFCFSASNDVGAVVSVKEGCPAQYPNITYEQAFENYFANTTWDACGQDEYGNEVVKFTGVCTYLGSDAVAEVTFTIYEEQSSFVVSSVKLNGEDMDYWGTVLIMDVFEEYQNGY